MQIALFTCMWEVSDVIVMVYQDALDLWYSVGVFNGKQIINSDVSILIFVWLKLCKCVRFF